MKYTPESDRRSGYRPPISPDRWGGVFWDTLHFVSLGYPVRDPSPEMRQAAFEFLRALPFLLPCKVCREHLAETYLWEMPLDKDVFASQQRLGEYIVQLRDLVKAKHVCPSCEERPHSFPEDVERRLLRDRPNRYWVTLIPILLFFILYRFYARSRRHHG